MAQVKESPLVGLEKKQRKQKLAKIHILKKELRLDDDTYRQIIEQVTGGKVSASQCSQTELVAVIRYLKEKQVGKPPKNIDQKPQLQKIGALLADKKLNWDYARGIARQMFKKETLEFLTSTEMTAIITALTKYEVKTEV